MDYRLKALDQNSDLANTENEDETYKSIISINQFHLRPNIL